MIGYFIALLPFYIFVYTPLSTKYSDYLPNLQHLSQSPSYSNIVPFSFNESFIAIEDPEVTGPQAGMCPEHTYKSFILSREPLVIYIKGFLSESESEHLLENG
jgi:prolyl 4-hydroxylase